MKLFSKLKLAPKAIAKMIGLSLVFLLCSAQLAPPSSEIYSLLSKMDGMFYDYRLRATLDYRPVYNETNIAIIDIDEKSLAEQGRWPWSRRKLSLIHI